ncbi:alpha-2-macroglobulin family protein [Algicella marina]|nr:alpha-2-macroglobulin family protein [Algicella marina]
MRPLFRFLTLVASLSLSTVATAQTELPERRMIYEENVDFFGGDIRSIFDTTPELCERACREEASCSALTFNLRANACFLKTEVTRRDPYEGAYSARMLETPAIITDRAETRTAALDGMPDRIFEQAHRFALTIGRDYPDRGTDPADLRAVAQNALGGNAAVARGNALSAAALSDAAEDWYLAASASLALIDTGDYSARSIARRIAVNSALNAYLRAGDPVFAATTLTTLAAALEADGNGRESIPALRLAQTLSPRGETAAALDRAIRLFGFRIVDSRVESNAADPRICVSFSEPLREKGFDYAPYVRLPDGDFAVEASASDLCIVGAEHGSSVAFSLRQGLPALSGETLHASVEQSFYVRDREPSVRFLGRNYVLARSREASIPVVTVNTDTLVLELFQIEDRNLTTAFRDNLVNRPLQGWETGQLGRELGTSIWKGTGETANALNEDTITALPLGEAVAYAEPGVYAVTARVEGARSGAYATQWFIITDLGVATTSGDDGVHVFVRSLASAQPKVGVSVVLLAENNGILGEVETNAEGHAHFAAGLTRGTNGAQPALVSVSDGAEDYAYLSLSEAGFDLSDRGVEGRPSPGPIDLFLATDRGAYRPGETVNATILARDSRADAIDGLPLTARILRPDGVEHRRMVLDDAGGGGRTLSLSLPEAAQRGGWTIALHADPEKPALTSESFLVEDFVPERVDFTLDLQSERIRLSDRPLLSIAARYLYGAPGAELSIEGETQLRATQDLAAYRGYRFGPHDTASAPVYAGIEGQPVTDADGSAVLALPLGSPAEALGPFEMTATIRLADASRRVVERQITAPVAPDGPLIGVLPLFDGTVPEGGTARFSAIAVDPDAERIAMMADWVLERIETTYQWYEYDGNWRYDAVTRRSRIGNGTLDIAADGAATLEVPVDWGRYQLTLSSEERGYAVTSMTFDAGYYSVGGGTDTPDKLAVSLDKLRYGPGEAARLRYTAETDGQLLIAVASDRLIDMQVQQISAGSGEVALDVTDDWHPGAYVTATLIRPLDGASSPRAPVRALGLGWVGLEHGDAEITAQFTSAAEASPRQVMKAVLQTDAAEGTQVWATIAATDLGILNLTGHQPPDPVEHYLGQRQLGVTFRDLYGRLIDPALGTPGRLRSGGDETAGGLKSPPPTEALLAFFSGPIEVGADGVASADFALPDFNGTVRLDAIVWSADGVGAATQDVLVRDPVVVSAAMPRFLAPGDAATLAIDVANVTGPSGAVAVRVESKLLGLRAEQMLVLDEGARGRLSFPLNAARVGDAAITVTTTLADDTILTKNLTLGIRRNDPEVARQSRFNLAAGTGGITLDGQIFAGLAPGTGTAVLSAGPLARFDVPGLLTSLDRYPYGCTEQVTSRALPLLYFREVAAGLGLTERRSLEERIAQAVEDVLARQAGNGSFGMWSSGGDGNLWLDAYVSDFLTRARVEGFDVPDRAFDAALRNLRNRVNAAPDFENGGEDIAYALYVLAREGEAAIGDLRYYADARADAFATPLALAQIGAGLAAYGEPVRADGMFRRAVDMLGIADDSLWRSDFGSTRRDTAAVLTLATEAGSDAALNSDLGARVAARSTLNDELSTQESAWTLLAARALLADSGASNLTRDGAPVSGPMVDSLTDKDLALSPVTIGNVGTGDTEAVLTVFGVPTEPEPAGGNGYRISRAYYDLDGNSVDPGEVQQGSRLVAVLNIVPERDNEARLMIDDPLPAGFEIESPNLLRGGEVGALDWLQLQDVARHTAFGTDRFRAAVDWRGTEGFRLGYILRAVSPGTFHHPAASVEDMYRPAYRARTAAGEVRIVAE